MAEGFGEGGGVGSGKGRRIQRPLSLSFPISLHRFSFFSSF